MRTNPSEKTDHRSAGHPRRHRLPLAMVPILVWLLAACSGGGTHQDLFVELASGSDAEVLGVSELEGAVLSGAVELEVREAARFVSVAFHVDDPDLREEPALRAEERPFRVALDTAMLRDGEHTLTVTAEVTSGRPPVVTKRFVVANDPAADGVVPGDAPSGSGGGTGSAPREDVDAAQGSAPAADAEGDAGGDREGAADEEGGAADAPADDPSASEGGTGTTAPGVHDVPAATLFVAPHGDDGNDGRSAARPLRSVRRAASLVRPGDVVYLRGGVYPIGVEFTTSGTSSSPIVWTSYPGEWAVFDGSGHTPVHDVAKFHVRSSWNVFMNLEVRNAPQEGIYVEAAHDNVFRGIVARGNQYSGIGNVRSDRNLYEDIVTFDNYDDRTGGQHADGIAISSGDSNVVRRVVTFENSDDGIDVWKSTNTRIEYVASYRNGRGDSGEGNGIKAGGDYGWNGTIVRYTVSFDNRGNGFNENNGEGIRFENSTAYRNGGWDFMGSSTTTRRNNLAPASSTGMWGSPDERNSWNLGVAPRFVSDTFGSDGFLVPHRDSGALGAGVGGADLGAIPAGGSFRGLIGEVAFGLLSSR